MKISNAVYRISYWLQKAWQINFYTVNLVNNEKKKTVEL